MKYRRKKIWLNTRKTKYCIVKLYDHKKEMQCAYKEFTRDRKSSKVKGASCHYSKLTYRPYKLSPEVGTVFLCREYCGAAIVAHEFMHAVMWAYRHTRYKKQYPFVIKSMREEEVLLHNHSYAVMQFYVWYWKLNKQSNGMA